MSKPAAPVNLKQQDFCTFRATVQPFLDRLIQDNPPTAGEVIDRDKAVRDM